MTQRTINLYDGLEALYYFDSDYFDGTTGEIKDKSGHGRHATAQGGPTVGVNGPNDFQATSFDGSDDRFFTGNDFDAYDGEVTEFALFRIPDLNDFYRLHKMDQSGSLGTRFSMNTNENAMQWQVDDGSGAVTVHARSSGLNTDPGVFHSLIGNWDGSTARILQDGVLGDTASLSTRSGRGNNSELQIGTEGGGKYYKGEIVAWARWNRTLSEAEMEYLDRLTAPRRAQL